jgi:hypothetical protein
MQKQPIPWIPDDNPALVGPDYVALVIEWDDSAEPTQRIERKRGVPVALIQVASVAIAALGALGALAAWGIHRLRPAPAL